MLRLFRHAPTSRWLPLIQDAAQVTPGTAYLPDLAREYQLAAGEIEIVEALSLPLDFETAGVPRPPPTLTPKQQERVEAATFDLPTFAEIDALVETIFPDLTGAQRTYLKRLSKLVRALSP